LLITAWVPPAVLEVLMRCSPFGRTAATSGTPRRSVSSPPDVDVALGLDRTASGAHGVDGPLSDIMTVNRVGERGPP